MLCPKAFASGNGRGGLEPEPVCPEELWTDDDDARGQRRQLLGDAAQKQPRHATPSSPADDDRVNGVLLNKRGNAALCGITFNAMAVQLAQEAGRKRTSPSWRLFRMAQRRRSRSAREFGRLGVPLPFRRLQTGRRQADARLGVWRTNFGRSCRARWARLACHLVLY